MVYKKSRRTFLTQLSSLLIGSTPFVSLLSACATTGLPSYRQTMRGSMASLDLSQYSELSESGGAIQLEMENVPDPVVVVRLSEKDFAALSPICTHLGCTVRKERSFFRCPCHGSTYTLEGAVVRGPAEKPLARFRIEQFQNKLFIHF